MTGSRAYPHSTADLIPTHCIRNTEVVSNQVPIAWVALRPLRSILWMIVRLAGAKSQHVATKAQMLLALDYMQPQVFDWCDGVVRRVRAELTACKTRTQREFGYGTLVVSFLLERILLMRPRIVTMPLLPRTGEAPICHCFDDGFFDWLDSQIIMIEDYPYAGMNFTSDLELVLPLGTQ